MDAATVLEIDSDVEEVQKDAFTLELERQLQSECIADDKDDPERLPREMEPYPPLPDPVDPNVNGERAKAAAQLRQQTEAEASAALAANDVQRAIDQYTLAMRTSGATAMMLSNRAALLLKQKRACASIRDCTAALKINASMVKAYRLRAIAHRKLGNWKKAYADVSKAQDLKYDGPTAELHKAIDAKCLKLGVAIPRPSPKVAPEKRAKSRSSSPKRSPAARPGVQTADMAMQAMQAAMTPAAPVLKDLDKGQAVILEGLAKAPHLNGKRGMVERKDPRPAATGRWEVEVRMPGGVLEIKSLKRENIATLNKADRYACKAWALEEKKHKEEREQREQNEEQAKYRRCVDAKLGKLNILEHVKEMLRKLKPQDALTVLDKVDSSNVLDVNEFLKTQVKLTTGEHSDSDDEPASKKLRA